MGNKTEEHPEGILNGDILKTFYAVSGEDGDFKYTRGHERIPDNWYTRNIGDPYSITYLIADDLDMVLQHLDLDSVGGNTGTVDSFTGVDLANLTGGVLNAASLLEDNNLFCFAMVRIHICNTKESIMLTISQYVLHFLLVTTLPRVSCRLAVDYSRATPGIRPL